MSGHTPGPWEWLQPDGPTGGGQVRAVNGINRHIAMVSGNVSGNSPLLAAAPEILAELKNVCARVRDGAGLIAASHIERAEVIIAKAEGKA